MERGTLQPTTFVTEKKEGDARGFDRVMSFAIIKKIDKTDSCQEMEHSEYHSKKESASQWG